MESPRQNNKGCREPVMVLCAVISTLLAVLAFLGIQKYTDLSNSTKTRESQSQSQSVGNEFQSDTSSSSSTPRSRGSSEGGNGRQKTDDNSTPNPSTSSADSGQDTIIKPAPTPEKIEFTVGLKPTNPYETGILEVTVFINNRRQGVMNTNLGLHKLTIYGTNPGYYSYELKGIFYGVSNQGLTRLRDFYGRGTVYATNGSSFRIAINSADFSLSLAK